MGCKRFCLQLLGFVGVFMKTETREKTKSFREKLEKYSALAKLHDSAYESCGLTPKQLEKLLLGHHFSNGATKVKLSKLGVFNSTFFDDIDFDENTKQLLAAVGEIGGKMARGKAHPNAPLKFSGVRDLLNTILRDKKLLMKIGVARVGKSKSDEVWTGRNRCMALFILFGPDVIVPSDVSKEAVSQSEFDNMVLKANKGRRVSKAESSTVFVNELDERMKGSSDIERNFELLSSSRGKKCFFRARGGVDGEEIGFERNAWKHLQIWDDFTGERPRQIDKRKTNISISFFEDFFHCLSGSCHDRSWTKNIKSNERKKEKIDLFKERAYRCEAFAENFAEILNSLFENFKTKLQGELKGKYTEEEFRNVMAGMTIGKMGRNWGKFLGSSGRAIAFFLLGLRLTSNCSEALEEKFGWELFSEHHNVLVEAAETLARSYFDMCFEDQLVKDKKNRSKLMSRLFYEVLSIKGSGAKDKKKRLRHLYEDVLVDDPELNGWLGEAIKEENRGIALRKFVTEL